MFLNDSGADISATPATACDQANGPSFTALYAANNTPLHRYGVRTLTVDLGLRRDFTWNFVIADVSTPILGADFTLPPTP